MERSSHFEKVLVTDFDGTMTVHDFYTCAVKYLLSPDDLQPWDDYTQQKISHFEALKRIFQRIRASDADMEKVLRAMQFDPKVGSAVKQLNACGWNVIVVSNGCGWYIQRLFEKHCLNLELHTNPGVYSMKCGLQLQLPKESPFFSVEFGISKSEVVRTAIANYRHVAFAGDGRPDLEPAMMISPQLRFARQWLAAELTEKNEAFRGFKVWSDISMILCEEGP